MKPATVSLFACVFALITVVGNCRDAGFGQETDVSATQQRVQYLREYYLLHATNKTTQLRSRSSLTNLPY